MKHLSSCLLAVVCVSPLSLTCFGQNLNPLPSPSFTSASSPSGPSPLHIYGIDVNNDGFTDILQDAGNPGITGGFFSVSLSNGDGTFKPPVTYKVNSNTWTPLTYADFNKDGKVDIAVALPGTNQVAVYFGNGDGTFQAPIAATVALPSGMTFANSPIVAADFNHDGHPDLVAAITSSDQTLWQVYLLEGDGTGQFPNPSRVYTPTSGWTIENIVEGDFDTDGNADVALLESMPCSDGSDNCSSNVISLFGDGGTDFQFIDVTTVNGAMSLGAADLNTDGATDLYGVEYATNQLAYFSGHYDRAWSYQYAPIKPSTAGADEYFGSTLAVADFQGNWDLLGIKGTVQSGNSETYQTGYILDAAANTPEYYYLAEPDGKSTGYQVGPVAGIFNRDQKPDFAINVSSSTNSPTSTLAVGLNSASGTFGACNYPSTGQGILLCAPMGTENPQQAFTFEATAASYGQLRKIELWVDGDKLYESHLVWGQYGFLDWSWTNPVPGPHNGTIYAADIDNTLQRYDFTFTVSGN